MHSTSVAGFEDDRRDHKPRNVGSLEKLEKASKVSLEPPKGPQLCKQFDFRPVTLTSGI